MLTGYMHGMIDRDVVQLRHQSTQAGENVDFTFYVYVVGLNQLQTTRHSHLNFEILSIDITYVKN